MWDVEGTRYIDYVQSYGASILGHAHPKVIEAIRAAALDGTTFGAPTRREVELAETLCAARAGSRDGAPRLVGHRSRDDRDARSRAVRPGATRSSSSPAATTATPTRCWRRAAVAWPTKVCRDATASPPGAVADTIVAPYNVVPELDDRVAAVIVEPVAANMGLVAPAPGFSKGCARMRSRRRAVDLRRGDHRVPALPRRCRAMVRCPSRSVVLRQGHRWRSSHRRVRCDGATSCSTSPPSVACTKRARCRATRWRPRPGWPCSSCSTTTPLRGSTRSPARLGKGLHDAFARRGHARGLAAGRAAASGCSSATANRPTSTRPMCSPATAATRWYSTSCCARGVALAPGPYEIMFPSLAHGDDVLDATIAAVAT